MTSQALPAPSRVAGLSRLSGFVAGAGSRYARTRNFDFGPERRGNTSGLSPYVRHRLVLEQELLESTLESHSFSAATKFIEEVFWRTYFKGWLEQHPTVWTDYVRAVSDELRGLQSNSRQLDRYNTATNGNTGIDCFDGWIEELVTTGYLHNHARMWFASIWVFTLNLPWQLGADFFLRHLLDGDPASNTLSWRWVSGLHTRGKTYLARVSNIVNFTDGRFNPQGKLATSAKPVTESRLHALEALPRTASIPEDQRFGLLVSEDDCAPEMRLVESRPSAILGLVATRQRSPLPVGIPAFDFARGAVRDAVARAERAFQVPGTVVEDDDAGDRIIHWAAANQLNTIVTPHVPVGPAGDLLDSVRERLDGKGIRLLQLRRDYDSISWPHATRGFFSLKKALPAILSELGIVSEGAASKAG